MELLKLGCEALSGFKVTHDDSETLKKSTTANPSIPLETQRIHLTVLTALPLFSHLTPESFAALAVEHLCLLDLARGAVLAWIWLAGVVATFTYTAAIQTVTAVLLQVEHTVVDI